MIFQSKNVWIDEQLQPAQIEINEGKITGVYRYNSYKCDKDFGELWILPGFTDIHTHGENGADANKLTFDDFKMWCQHLPQEGVTSYVVSTYTQADEKNVVSLKNICDYIDSDYQGAEAVGINIEGNFISKNRPGAQEIETIIGPRVDILDKYYQICREKLLTVTYACEDDKDHQFLNYCLAHKIRASIGHCVATYQQAEDAAKHGATGVTHTGNGMPSFHHRTPGLFGAAVNIDSLYAECIGDGVHVDFQTMHLIGTMKGKDKMIMITDSATEKDDPQYDYMKTSGAYKREDGTLFGSCLYVNKGVYNMLYKANLPLVTAINAVTINPARYLGFDNRKGTIQIGKDADIVICNDQIELTQVYCKGVAQL